MAVISLVMEAMGTTLAVFLRYTALPSIWSITSAEEDRMPGVRSTASSVASCCRVRAWDLWAGV